MEKANKKLTLEEVKDIYNSPLLKIVFEASKIHSKYHTPFTVKAGRLISVKTGNCVEDCSYCAQSSRYNANTPPSTILSTKEVKELAKKAKDEGLNRVCLSGSYKNMPSGKGFEKILSLIEIVKEMDLEVCLTMGKVTAEQAQLLSKSGIKAYNHNIDTSESHYPSVISTRTFKERIETLQTLSENGVNVCSGGILGMGETDSDRISMLHTLCCLTPHPFTVPLNVLVPIKGTPLEDAKRIDDFEMIRTIATTRIIMPSTNICLAAGRKEMSETAQALCFLAGVNAIFIGDKLLTTDNSSPDKDIELFEKLGLKLI